jgi:hypothetical protein
MAFRVEHARYDSGSKRAYVELRDADRDADDDRSHMIVSAIFSFRTKASLSKREIEQDVMRKAKFLFNKAAAEFDMGKGSEGRTNGNSEGQKTLDGAVRL